MCGGISCGGCEEKDGWVGCDLMVGAKVSVVITADCGQADIESYRGQNEKRSIEGVMEDGIKLLTSDLY